jgi:hypothetical protein
MCLLVIKTQANRYSYKTSGYFYINALITNRHLQNLGFISLVLLFSVIVGIVLIQLTYKVNISSEYYLTHHLWYAKENLPFNKYQFVQTVYAQGNGETTAVSNATNEEATDTLAIKQADTTITITSLIISFGIVSGIFIFVNYSLKGSNMKFGDIIRDGSGFPSLARFQFLLWTFIVLFAVLGVLLIRLFMGISEIPNDIPENLLILTGISVAVPFVSNPISGIKYGERKPPTGTLRDEDRRRLATMLMENDKPTVSRFQMFAWTIISIIVYLGFFFSQTIFLLTDVNELEFPDIPQIFVYLMGLSQAGYVGVKATVSKALTVTQVLPKQAHINEDVIIVGTNFGSEKGSVFFEDGPKDAAGNQVPVQPQDIKEWQETRIHIKVPSQGLVAGTNYYIRVQNRGLISYKGGGQGEEARFTML